MYIFSYHVHRTGLWEVKIMDKDETLKEYDTVGNAK
jgi:hypothetical protein